LEITKFESSNGGEESNALLERMRVGQVTDGRVLAVHFENINDLNTGCDKILMRQFDTLRITSGTGCVTKNWAVIFSTFVEGSTQLF